MYAPSVLWSVSVRLGSFGNLIPATESSDPVVYIQYHSTNYSSGVTIQGSNE